MRSIVPSARWTRSRACDGASEMDGAGQLALTGPWRAPHCPLLPPAAAGNGLSLREEGFQTAAVETGQAFRQAQRRVAALTASEVHWRHPGPFRGLFNAVSCVLPRSTRGCPACQHAPLAPPSTLARSVLRGLLHSVRLASLLAERQAHPERQRKLACQAGTRWVAREHSSTELIVSFGTRRLDTLGAAGGCS